jgi:hypothetical protein
MDTRSLRLLACIMAFTGGVVGTGCHPGDVSVSDVKADPPTANKGDTAQLDGEVGSMDVIKSVSYSVADGSGKPATGVSVTANALGDDKTSWNLHTDADAKIVVAPDAPSGKYQIKIEAKTDAQTKTESVDFTVR